MACICFYDHTLTSTPDPGDCFSGDVGSTGPDFKNEPFIIAAIVDGVDTGKRYLRGVSPHRQDGSLCEPKPPSPTRPDQPCDCLNGGCVPSTTYKTPGKYPNLTACQSGCAKDSNCTGECIDPAEIAALQQAANVLQSKICK